MRGSSLLRWVGPWVSSWWVVHAGLQLTEVGGPMGFKLVGGQSKQGSKWKNKYGSSVPSSMPFLSSLCL